jgi:iron complex outermembrane receptor protein
LAGEFSVKKFVLLCTTAMLPSAVFAQSTGTVDFEKQAIVVTGTRAKDVGGVLTPDTPKAKVVLTQEMISRQQPGQSILDTINMVPGVSFQNNDAYGSSGGTLTIRGFDSSRISLTFDGVPLNDSGNYAIYSNQQLDPELIEQVNVNLGSTDVDSPTASAVGGSVNYRTINPSVNPGVRFVGSLGDWHMWRVFGLINTGEIGPWGTRMFLSASRTQNNVPYNGYGKIDKRQFNAKIYQTIGSNGDFLSLAGNYNENRNNFFGSLPLRTDRTQSATNPAPRIVGANSGNRYPTSRDERFYQINFPCQLDTPQTGGSPDTTAAPPPNSASCGTEFDRRYNPSNTGNIRGSSRFTLADGLVLTVDPSYQYVKANGGGTIIGREGFRVINGVQYTGFIGGQYYFGRDLNGDGDVIDTCSTTGGSCSSSNFAGVTLLAPSQTHTDRYGLNTTLRWDFARGQMFRVGYTLDDARHRQTGEVGYVLPNGEPQDVFPINDPILDANGFKMEKRDRLSFAVLHQLFAEYRGDFGPLTVNVGLKGQHFIRNLTNYCFTTSASGFFDCFGQNATLNAAYATANPQFQGPQSRRFTYDKLLPNVGLIYDLTNQLSAFGSYAKGLSVPSTDNLYNSFFFAPDEEQAKPKPEETDSFDGGLRFRTSKIQAQLSGWYTHFTNRQAQAFDPELNVSVFRNLGTVNKYGIDGSIAYEPVRQLTLYAFGSWNKSKIEDNIQTGRLPSGVTCDNVDPTSTQGLQNCAFTAGNRESGAPEYSYGLSAVGDTGPVQLGIEAKRTGPRFVFDNNLPVFRGDIGITTPTTGRVLQEQVYSAKVPAYWLVNLSARAKLDWLSPALKKTYLQFNLYNAFDKFYVGGFGGGLSESTSTRCAVSGQNPCLPANVVPTWGSVPFVQIGAPRTFSATLNLEF